MTSFYRVCLAGLFALTLACSESSENPPLSLHKTDSSAYRVDASFEVGRNVVVRALALDQQKKRLWVGTTVGVVEVSLEKGEMLNTFTRENGLANEYVFAAMVDKESGVWFGTNGGGVSLYQQGNWRTFFPMHGLADYWVYSFAEEENGQVWIGTWAGLNKYDRSSDSMTTYVKELVNEWVYGLDIDSKGNVWVGTEGGVNMYDGRSWAVWTHQDGLGAANSEGLPFSENTGLGTRSRHDLSMLMSGKETYNPNYVFCIKVSRKDEVWAGTWGGGVSVFNGSEWTNYTQADGLAGNIVYSIAIAQDDSIWFGTNNGLSHFDGKSWQALGVNEGLLDSHVYAIVAEDSGDIWAGTRNGVVKISKNSSDVRGGL